VARETDVTVALTLRRTGLSSPAYRDWLDYVIVEDGRNVGRLYEDRHSRPEYRWFWSITVYVNPARGIVTSGRASTIEEAKAQFLANWEKCGGDSSPGRVARLTLGLTEQDVARVVGITLRTYRKYEAGRKPRSIRALVA